MMKWETLDNIKKFIDMRYAAHGSVPHHEPADLGALLRDVGAAIDKHVRIPKPSLEDRMERLERRLDAIAIGAAK